MAIRRLQRLQSRKPEFKLPDAISIKPTIGVGDALQFSSLPENYFRTYGKKLVDVNKHWFFDYNPFVLRDVEYSHVQEMWNWPTQFEWPIPRPEGPQVYLCNAEIWASLFKAKLFQNRPRLYRFEEYPYEKREMILLHTDGISHGKMPEHVLLHILKKYGNTGKLYLVGKSDENYGLPRIETPTLWDLAEVISKAKMFIGMDSGPSWIAACYPDVISKKIRMKPSLDVAKDWIPLEIKNIHSHWDDRCHQIFNIGEDDVGFMQSYRKM